MKKTMKNPFTKIVFLYGTFVFVGMFLLHMNIFMKPDKSITMLEALFTSVSSFATTGLSLFDYLEVYNYGGQLLMIIFFNIGGMGIMTMNTLLFVIVGRKIGVKNRLLAKIDLNRTNSKGMVQLIKTIAIMFIVVELIGAILIFFKIGYMGMGIVERFMTSLFMASSACVPGLAFMSSQNC